MAIRSKILYILRHPMMLTLNIEIFFYRFIHFLERNYCVVYYLRHKRLCFSRDGLSVCLSVSWIIRPDVAGGKVSPGMGI